MSKMPIDWHEGCVINREQRLMIMLEKKQQLDDDICRFKVEIGIYRHQIEEAKKRGVDSFDRDRFGKPRRQK